MTAEEMDFERREAVARRYLARLAEAREWINRCLQEDSQQPPSYADEDEDTSMVMAAMSGGLVAFEESLRNGVALARLAAAFAPQAVSYDRIFDIDLERYESCGLSYRHTDNINYFIDAIKQLGLPEIFVPEMSDVYERKNMPRLVFCLHALATYLAKMGLAPPMPRMDQNGDFNDSDVTAMKSALEDFQGDLPRFADIDNIMERETGTRSKVPRGRARSVSDTNWNLDNSLI